MLCNDDDSSNKEIIYFILFAYSELMTFKEIQNDKYLKEKMIKNIILKNLINLKTKLIVKKYM